MVKLVLERVAIPPNALGFLATNHMNEANRKLPDLYGHPDVEKLKGSPTVDMAGQTCLRCGKGKYVEKSINDDWEGRQICNNCGHKIHRHLPKEIVDRLS